MSSSSGKLLMIMLYSWNESKDKVLRIIVYLTLKLAINSSVSSRLLYVSFDEGKFNVSNWYSWYPSFASNVSVYNSILNPWIKMPNVLNSLISLAFMIRWCSCLFKVSAILALSFSWSFSLVPWHLISPQPTSVSSLSRRKSARRIFSAVLFKTEDRSLSILIVRTSPNHHSRYSISCLPEKLYTAARVE